MTLSTLLYRISYLAIAPGLIAMIVTFVGAQTRSTSDLVRWCTLWWWFALIAGYLVFCLIRSTAWLLRRHAGA